jgi:hypothetical protein
MFSFLKKKSKVQTLEAKYQKLISEAYQLSKSNRIESDKKRAEAEQIANEIESLRNTVNNK